VNAQRYFLHHSGTLYSSFENPSEDIFVPNKSKQYAVSFLLGSLGFYLEQDGPAQDMLRQVLFENKNFSANDLPLLANQPFTTFFSSNQYLAMFKMCGGITSPFEYGFSWQIKSIGYGSVTNQMLKLLNDYTLLANQSNNTIKDNAIAAQSYHQLSFSIRQDLNPYVSVGAKIGLLSGIGYMNASLDALGLDINLQQQSIAYQANAQAKVASAYPDLVADGSSLKTVNGSEQKWSYFLPTFRNPGAAISFGCSLNNQNGLFASFNIKDLGFINWSTNSFVYTINQNGTATGTSQGTIIENIQTKIKDDLQPKKQSFIAPTETLLDMSVSQKIGFYKPVLVVGKYLFNPYGFVAFTHNFNIYPIQLGLSTGWNTYGTTWTAYNMGAQLMYQTPNGEFYIGSEQLLRMLEINSDAQQKISHQAVGGGSLGLDFYLGFSFKFGRVAEDWGISSYSNFENGFWNWLFGWKTHRRFLD